MTTYYINREVRVTAEGVFELDIPDSIVEQGDAAIKDYIHSRDDWRDYMEVQRDKITYEKDEE